MVGNDRAPARSLNNADVAWRRYGVETIPAQDRDKPAGGALGAPLASPSPPRQAGVKRRASRDGGGGGGGGGTRDSWYDTDSSEAGSPKKLQSTHAHIAPRALSASVLDGLADLRRLHDMPTHGFLAGELASDLSGAMTRDDLLLPAVRTTAGRTHSRRPR